MNKFRIASLSLVLLLFKLNHVIAGDFAEFHSLGFSADGKVYAFEQFGIMDGSGFPYADRFLINVESDTYVKGTPFRVRIEDEEAGVLQARKLVAEKSDVKMKALGIGTKPGRLVAFNPSTEVVNDSKSITYFPNQYKVNLGEPITISLETFEAQLPSGHDCQNYGGLDINIFRLKLRPSPDEASETIYEDKSLPKSRRCPQDYNIGGVVTLDEFGEPAVHVFLVLYESFGFEGPDGRWIAIPKVMN
ncbi:DUF2259 domain-containing protein [Lentilitoribacter sp. Alg239-R112]|uniref:DUF2259 domain-containing protein n=1 Tax=Lentilitoribacter sp. Alg239-R112 TaxID=2305987 RepID=UPI0013A6D498|nr:DUF2259 domain-containing protein [Lentilitoribacter sp. Alg239-R112]